MTTRPSTAKAGRPAFEPTAALRKRVSICAGAGMSHEELALALNISRNTLEKHFAHELSVGAYERRVEVIAALHKSALKGNVTAAREFLKLDPRLAPPPAVPPPSPEPRAEKVGKKEQAQQDAATAQVGTEWNDLLAPTATPLLQ